jgi:drug/metabolite transporter (DMT)-like permease
MPRSALLGAAFVLIWSNGYVVGSIASHAAPPLAVTFWRLVLAGAILAGLAIAGRARWPHEPRVIGAIAVVGALLFGVQFGGVYLAMGSGMPAGTSALLISACPLVVAITQALLGAERLAGRQWLGAALGMTGVVVALLDRLAGPSALAPLLWTIIGLGGFAAAAVLTPRLVPNGVDARAVTSIECLAGSVLLVPWALLHGGLAVPLTGPALGSAAGLTVVNGVGGSLVLLALVQTRGATRASSLLFVVPAVTAIASWPVLGEAISATTLAGLAIAAVGIALVQRGPVEPRDRSTPPAPAPLAPTMGG